jgi:hypothetical protein
MSLEDRNAKFSEVEGELMVLSITSAGQELALQEQGETIRSLERTVEAERRALEVERKQVEGEPLFDSCVVGFSLRVRTLFLTSFSSGNFRLAHRAWARGRAGRGAADLLQLLRAGAAGVA